MTTTSCNKRELKQEEKKDKKEKKAKEKEAKVSEKLRKKEVSQIKYANRLKVYVQGVQTLPKAIIHRFCFLSGLIPLRPDEISKAVIFVKTDPDITLD
jgi:hypothetical protein